MHWTTHVITGAALGSNFKRRLPAVTLGIASHLVFDATPHHDPDSDVGYVLDSLLGLTALSTLVGARFALRRKDLDTAVWGAIGAALPDVELLVKLAANLDNEQLVFPTHNGILPHREAALWPSLASEAMLTAIALVPLALRFLRHKVRPSEAPDESGG